MSSSSPPSLLTLISQCETGMTINLNTMSLCRKNLWTGVRRWWQGEHRNHLLLALEIELSRIEPGLCCTQILEGLRNLAQTYHEDTLVFSRFSELIALVERRNTLGKIRPHIYTKVGHPQRTSGVGLASLVY